MGRTQAPDVATLGARFIDPEQLLTRVWTLEDENARLRNEIAMLEESLAAPSTAADDTGPTASLDEELDLDELPRDGAWLRAGFSVALIALAASLVLTLSASLAAGDSGLLVSARLRSPVAATVDGASAAIKQIATRAHAVHPRYGRGLVSASP